MEWVGVAGVGGWVPVVYAVASFLLVLAAALLAYVACSRRYRLNWFERNLLESEELRYSKEALIVSGGEDGGSTAGIGSSRSLNKSPSCDKFWVPPNLKRQSSLDNSSPEESGVGSPVSGDVTMGASILEAPSKVEKVQQQQQVALASVRPRVNSMHRQLDHTKIDAALYDQQVTSHGATDEGGEEIIRGSVNLTLVYDLNAGILTVRLIQAVDLQPRDFSGTADPYAKIRLLPDRTNVWQTRIHKKTLNPVFDEDFVFEVRRGGVARRTLELVLYDFDAYSRHHSIGCVQLPLAGLDLDQKLTLWKALSPCLAHHDQAKEELGEVLISLSFLPSAERLTVVVIKARNLRAVDETRASSDPYVKVSLWVNGRRYKRKKTSVARNTTRPVFNEALTFDIGREALAKNCRVEVSVLHAGGGPAATGEPLGTSCLSSDSERRLFHDLLSAKSGQTALTRWLPLTDPD
ncbi:synaptotagmin-1 [Nilaparvata lugens]|uniref:synaptotagmin-1 n=1 Tax=Nilaparvata lugens TaxID=108931 RepID=UPI00193D2BF5|nr:synaptotagmin-1 [Nilaparvata lugens]